MHRILASVFVVATVTACAGGDVAHTTPPEGYLQDAPARVAAVDWSTAETVEVVLSEYDFAPAALSFEAGRPYRLVLRNAGSSTHTFTSRGFFQAIAVQKLVPASGEQDRPYIENIEVPAGGAKELTFVAVRAGNYPLECSVFLHDAFGMTGDITIR
jgi:uncharacterized cupredoxin-like copper-binding protein